MNLPALYVAGEIIQVIEAMPGSVVPLAMFLQLSCFYLFDSLAMSFHGYFRDKPESVQCCIESNFWKSANFRCYFQYFSKTLAVNSDIW